MTNAKQVLTAEQFRKAVLAHVLDESRLYRIPAEREAPFDVTECEWHDVWKSVGKPVASITLNFDGSHEQREFDGKRTKLLFAINKESTKAIVCRGGGFSGFGVGRGFMVEANGKVSLMWMS
jgi:hypothetical protein